MLQRVWSRRRTVSKHSELPRARGQLAAPSELPRAVAAVRPTARVALIVALLCFLRGTLPLAAQTFAPSAEWTSDAPLNDVFFIDADVGWAVGERGLILRTRDGGRSWETSRSPVTCSLDSVHFLNAEQGWAVGGYAHPITQLSTGVVLRTVDGGQSWRRIDRGLAPWLSEIQMHNDQRGWARGHRSESNYSGLLATRDGGQTWRTIQGEASGEWQDAAQRVSDEGFALVGRGRAAAASREGELKNAFVLGPGSGDLQALTLIDDRHGWAVGSDGQVLFTRDGGFSWDQPSAPPDPRRSRHFDWHTVAARGDRVWIAGQPGTRIARSTDQGQTWEWIETGIPTPIRKLFFWDEQRGWAVGDLGVILGTLDGGKSWRVLRQAAPRVVVWGVFESVPEVPLGLFARHCGNDGYLGAISLRAAAPAATINRVPAADRLRQALAGIGVGGYQVGLERSPETEAEGSQATLEWLVRELRTWRPAVVVSDVRSTASASGSESRSAAWSESLLQEAFIAAGDASRFPEQLRAAGLEPWLPQKLYLRSATHERADESLPLQQFAPRLGTSLHDYCLIPQSLLREPTGDWEREPRWRIASSSLVRGDAYRPLLDGLDRESLATLQRPLPPIPPGNLQVMRNLARQEEWIERMIVTTATSDDDGRIWEREAERLLIGLSQMSKGNVLFHLAMRHETERQYEAAARALHRIVTDCPEHPLREGALIWLVRYYASAEARWRIDPDAATPHIQVAATLELEELPEELQPTPPGGRMMMVDDPIQVPFSARQVMDEQRIPDIDVVQREQHAERLLQQLRLHHPLVATLAPVETAAFSLQRRRRGLATAPEQVIATAKRAGGPWETVAAVERWLKRPQEAPPLPVLLCGPTSTPPRLDGKLDDAVWQNAAPVGLKWLNPTLRERQDPTTLRLARDREFLYLAVEMAGSSQPAAARDSEPAPRQRDADVDESRRLWIAFDIDRDFLTSLVLEIDEQGRLRESALGTPDWNPQWFVARQTNQPTHTLEIAIPFSQLGAWIPRPTETWGIRIRRLEAGEPAPPQRSLFSAPAPETLLMFTDEKEVR